MTATASPFGAATAERPTRRSSADPTAPKTGAATAERPTRRNPGKQENRDGQGSGEEIGQGSSIPADATPVPRVGSEDPTGLQQRRRACAFLALTKPRIVELLLVTTVPAMIVAEEGIPSLWLIAATLVGGSLAAGGANAVNMIFDRDIDRKMDRTRHRPLVTGEIRPKEAAVFAAVLSIGAWVWLWRFVNLLSAVLAASAVLFYVLVYTKWLKRISTRNIVIGGAAGAVPPLVGWAAVTGSLDWPPVLLSAVIFYWTPPHFWALAICYRSDYRAADVPMLPAVAGARATAQRILGYTLVLWALTLAFAPVADMGIVYWAAAGALGAVFTALAVALLRRPSTGRAMRLFKYSITYMVLLFGAIVADELLRRAW